MYTARMKFLIALLQLVSFVYPNTVGEHSPDSVVQQLYRQVVTRTPLGIPKGADKAALWPFLSKKLAQRLDAAQACENDYLRKHIGTQNQKPSYGWLETGLFSGSNERAIPADAKVEREEKEKDGSIREYVRLTYKESFETNGRPPSSANNFSWVVAAVVVLEDGRAVVDDVLLFTDDSMKIYSRLSERFLGCEGSHWVGEVRSTGRS